mgnify:CR=1 FL=1
MNIYTLTVRRIIYLGYPIYIQKRTSHLNFISAALGHWDLKCISMGHLMLCGYYINLYQKLIRSDNLIFIQNFCFSVSVVSYSTQILTSVNFSFPLPWEAFITVQVGLRPSLSVYLWYAHIVSKYIGSIQFIVESQ